MTIHALKFVRCLDLGVIHTGDLDKDRLLCSALDKISQARLIRRQLDGHSVVGNVNIKALVKIRIWLANLSVLLSFGRTFKPLKLFSNNMVKCLQCKFSHVLQKYLLY